jgi:hypothetical protein
MGTITIGMIGTITIETAGAIETNGISIDSGPEIRGREAGLASLLKNSFSQG